MNSRSIDIFWQDVRYGARGLRRTPSFTVAAVLTLALGIGANTTMFSLLDAVMFKPLPIGAADDLFVVYEAAPGEVSNVDGGTGRLLRFSHQRFEDLRVAIGGVGTLAAMTRVGRVAVRLATDAPLTMAQGQLVGGSYFETFRAIPRLGRLLGDDDNRQVDGHPFAVVSEYFWRRWFGGSPDVIGRGIVVNGRSFTIVGVVAAPFTGVWSDTRVDIWIPAAMQHALNYRQDATADNSDLMEPWIRQEGIAWLNLVGRAPRGEHERVRQRLETANRPGLERLADILGPGDEQQQVLKRRLRIEPFARGFSAMRTRFGDALLLLTALVGLVLLVACANVANLLLARSSARQREVAIRTALGATRGRLVRQLLTESVVLAAFGGLAGYAVGRWASDALAVLTLNVPADALPPSFTTSGRLAVYAALVSLVTAFVFGLAPAVRGTGAAPAALLVGGVRVASIGSRGMRPLVVAQLALSFVVIVTAGLFARSLQNYTRFDPGFERDALVVVAMDPLAGGYEREQVPALNQRLIETVGSLPGVTSAVVAGCGLGTGCRSLGTYLVEGYQPAPGEIVELQENRVGAGYFATVGMQVIDGRDFSERDTPDRPQVAVVSELTAKRYFAGRSPIGKRIGYDENLQAEIIGVVRDARINGLREAPGPTVYFSIQQPATVPRTLEVRVTGDPARAATAIRRTLERTEPGLVLDQVVTMSEQLERGMTQERLVTWLTSGFGVLALFLACIGLYGVLAYSVASRTKELGVRVALGADPVRLITMVLGDGLRLVIGGVAAGFLLTLVASRLASSLLFGISATDPLTYAAVGATLATVALLACYVPARRAASVHPVDALRAE